MNAPPTADELEFLGDEAFTAGRLEEALDHYAQAEQAISATFDRLWFAEPVDVNELAAFSAAMERLNLKTRDVIDNLQPPRSLEDQVDDMRDTVDESLAAGSIAHASRVSVLLADALGDLDDDGAESAYRQAVALARQVDAEDPELMLYTFTALINFLEPSEESVALAQEMVDNLIGRDEMYHPMRAAEAACCRAAAELKLSELAPHRLDHAVNDAVRAAIEAADGVCFHELSQALQRQVASVLRLAGRDTEAAQWQAEADKYERWELFSEQQIPGHVHLWDIRIDLTADGQHG